MLEGGSQRFGETSVRWLTNSDCAVENGKEERLTFLRVKPMFCDQNRCSVFDIIVPNLCLRSFCLFLRSLCVYL